MNEVLTCHIVLFLILALVVVDASRRSLGTQAGQYCHMLFIRCPANEENDFLSDMSKDKSF